MLSITDCYADNNSLCVGFIITLASIYLKIHVFYHGTRLAVLMVEKEIS